MASHRAWLSVGQLSRQLFQSVRYVRPNSVAPDNHDGRYGPAAPGCGSSLPLFTCVPPPSLPSVIITRRLTTSLPVGKLFRESENEFAYGVMSGLPGYQRTLHYHLIQDDPVSAPVADEMPQRAGWGTRAAQSLISGMDHLSISRSTPSSEPDPATSDEITDMVARCDQLSDGEIVRLLASLLSWPVEVISLRRLWRPLGVECCRRLPRWSTEQILLAGDLLYRLRLLRLTQYGTAMLACLGRRLHSLSPSQLVQYLFFVNVARRMHAVSQVDLERCILNCLPLLSVDEVGIICMGFFKTRTSLKSEALVVALVDKLLLAVASAKPETVCAILKLLRLSVPSRRWQLIMQVYDGLLPVVHTLNSLCQMHLLLLGTQLVAHHPTAVHTITALLHGQLSTLRLKDIERLMLVTMLFNYDPGAGFLRDVGEELRSEWRIEERRQYPKSLMSCLFYMSYHQACPLDLAADVLQPTFISSLESAMASYTGCWRELLALNTTLELDMPGFRSQLPVSYRQNTSRDVMSRLPSPEMPQLTNAERGLLSVHETLVAVAGGPDRVAMLHLLPAFVTPELVLCLDGCGQPMPLPAEYLRQPRHAIKGPLAGTDGLWCVVVYGNRQCYSRNDKRPIGNFLLRQRLLSRLGYRVMEVPWFEYQSQTQPGQMRGYLLRKLQRLRDVQLPPNLYSHPPCVPPPQWSQPPPVAAGMVY